MAAAPVPVLRPSVGFCIQTQSASSSSGGKWYVNMCKHKMCEMPIAYSGKPVSKDWILANGIGNMQVPFDIGSFRKLKERAEGAKTTTYCVDVVFNPLLIQLFMDDDFCKAIENFRPFVIGLALKRIEESIGVRLSADKVKLVKTLRYKDGEPPEGTVPREFTDLPGNADCFDEEVPKRTPPAEAQEPEPLIQDITPGAKKPAMKKGFLNSGKAKGALYGDGGSGEGVLPENAGDPLGYIPKKLRQTCKIVDCNSPEYQANQAKREAVEESNGMRKEMRDQLTKDMEKWCKTMQPDKWHEDLPEGTEEASAVQKYDNDYSRFDKVEDIEEPAPVEERDWYVDSKGVTRRIEKQPPRGREPEGAPPIAAAPAEEAAEGPAVKKGFLSDAKTPLYPKGSEQARAPLSEEELVKELTAEYSKYERATSSTADPADAGAGPERKPSVTVKAPTLAAPEFELKEAPEGGLVLSVSVPQLDSMQDVELDVTERRASLGFPSRSGLKPLQVELPLAVIPTKVKAKFSKKARQINVTLPAVR